MQPNFCCGDYFAGRRRGFGPSHVLRRQVIALTEHNRMEKQKTEELRRQQELLRDELRKGLIEQVINDPVAIGILAAARAQGVKISLERALSHNAPLELSI